MIWHDIQQNTGEWFNLRCGKITGSKLDVIMANEGKSFGKPAKDYALQLAIERVTGTTVKDDYINGHMIRGHEQEPIARALYEDKFFCTVTNGGFFDHGSVGCSPDGLVGDDGVIEIKSYVPSRHYANIKRNDFDPSYKWQVYGNLKFSQREWIDFISYCQAFPPGRQLYAYRIYRKDCSGFFERLEMRIAEFNALIDMIIQEIA